MSAQDLIHEYIKAYNAKDVDATLTCFGDAVRLSRVAGVITAGWRLLTLVVRLHNAGR